MQLYELLADKTLALDFKVLLCDNLFICGMDRDSNILNTLNKKQDKTFILKQKVIHGFPWGNVMTKTPILQIIPLLMSGTDKFHPVQYKRKTEQHEKKSW